MKIIPAKKSDLPDILKLQLKAFNEVAALLNNNQLPALSQNLKEVEEEWHNGIILKYIDEENNIIGSVRAYQDEKLNCHIGKLIVDPSHQKQGIEEGLMKAIEKYFILIHGKNNK